MASPPLPFEDRRKPFWPRLGQTLAIACGDPQRGYQALGAGRSLWAPWLLKLLLLSPAYLGGCVLLGLAQVALWVASSGQPIPPPPEAQRLLGILALGLLLAGPLLQALSMVLGGLILHGLLRLFRARGPGSDLRYTQRATGYTQAVVGLLGLIPGLGLIAYPAAKIALGLALARRHGTPPWRALAATLGQALLTFLTALALVAAGMVWLLRQDQRSRQILGPPSEVEPLPEEPLRPDRI